jgi:thiosulfate/3-mercaptopyruvate sulfurtransferase
LAELGCSESDQIVVYDDAGGAFAARAWWCIRWLGHQDVAVLDGGIGAWSGDLETTPATPAPGNFRPRPALTRTISAAELAASLTGATLVDARVQARFEGREEPIDPVAGHIPGASCLPFQGNLDASGHFLPATELTRRFAHLADADPLICYCGSGVTAAHNILALRIAGFAEPVLYPGSWSEWISDEQRPIATGQSASQ